MPTHKQARGDHPSISDQTAFWNEWNTDYRLKIPLPAAAEKRGRAVVNLLEQLSVSEPAILDIGCGNGWLCGNLAAFGAVTGIDLSDKAVEAAQMQYPDLRFLAGDFLTPSLVESKFDVVISLETIAHVPDKPAFCTRVAELLNPGGYFIITSQNRFVWGRTSKLKQSPGQIQNFLTMGELKSLLRPEFKILRSTTIIPAGDRGIFRFVNSYKLNKVLCSILGEKFVERTKERMGLGNTLVILAQKRKP